MKNEKRSRIGKCGCRHGGVKHSCFTLIELLVVIAIIAILAAILLPTLQAARDRSLGASCQSNLKQLGVTFGRYADDNDGWLPCGHGGSGYWWAFRMYFRGIPIVADGTPSVSGGREVRRRNGPVFYCPMRKKNPRLADASTEHFYVTPSWTEHFGGAIAKMTRAYSPSQKFVLIERTFTGGGMAVTLPRYSGNFFGHSGNKGNFLLMDGHVEALPPELPYIQPVSSSKDHAKFHYHWKPVCNTPVQYGKCKGTVCTI